MKTIIILSLMVTGLFSCKPKGPLIEPKDGPALSTASPASTTSSIQGTMD